MAVDTPGWVRDAVFYQVFPDRFARSERVDRPGPFEAWDAPPTNTGFKGGDLLGIVEHLDHIAGLGANALYLNPVFQSASNHRYHTYDYFTVDPLLGGNDALRELLDAAHARGMRVILDGVFNHTGRGFWAFHHVVETGAGSPYREWFHFDQHRLAIGRSLDPYPAGHGVRRRGSGDALRDLGYQAWWNIPALPKLNIAEPAVREYVWSVAEHWLRFGADGWRLDVPGEIQDPAFWAEFRGRCRAVSPDAYLVGEIWDVAPDWTSDERFDALMNYPLAEAILGFVGGPSLDERLLRSHHEYARTERTDGPGFAARLEALLGAYDPDVTAVQLNLLDSHDNPRLASLLKGDRRAIELAILVQATLPGAPCLYYGGEIGLRGGLDPDNRRAFPWDESAWDHELLAFVSAAFALRHGEPLLRHGALDVVAGDAGWVAFERSDPDDGRASLLVVVNTGIDAASVDLGERWQGVVAVEPLPLADRPLAHEVETDGGWRLEVPSRSGAVVRLRRGG
jgi:cyclomaltodextrinase / maltogenic alpha-amylase / neopullulanase